MKTFWNLTARERLTLTEEEVRDLYVPREAAEAGLLVPSMPIYEPLPEAPTIEPPEGRNVFIITLKTKDGDSNTLDVAFENQQDAEAFAALKPLYYKSRWRNSRYTRTVEATTGVELQIAKVCNVEEEDAYYAQREEYDEAVKRNEEKRSRYDREMGAINSSAKRIWTNWNKIREREAYLKQLRATLDEFIKVAEGNVNMAIKFLMKKVEHQAIYDMLNEFGDKDWTWDADMFGGCMAQDANPYRDIEDPAKSNYFG